MRKLDVSAISNTNGMPVKGGTLEHLQLAYQEALTALAKNIVGRNVDVTNAYILYGLVNSGTSSSMNVSAGAVLFSGEVFLVDAFTLTVATAAVASLSTSYYTTNADPVLFTDGVSRNVHQIRKIVFTDTTAGSGLFDFNNMLQTPLTLQNQVVSALPSSYTVYFKQNTAIFFSTAPNSTTITFDFTNAVPGTVVRLKWTYGSAKTLTVNQPSGSTVIRDSGNLASVASANNLLYMIYLGVNEAGNHEVSYTLKQF